MLPDLHTDFSSGRSGGLVFPSLSEFSTVYCDPHSQRVQRNREAQQTQKKNEWTQKKYQHRDRKLSFWLLDLWRSIHNGYKCQIITLYTWNVNYTSKKNKIKKKTSHIKHKNNRHSSEIMRAISQIKIKISHSRILYPVKLSKMKGDLKNEEKAKIFQTKDKNTQVVANQYCKKC